MNNYVMDFDSWLKESKIWEMGIDDYKKMKKVKRFLDESLELNESTSLYFSATEKYKNALDNLLVECIINYIETDGRMNEGILDKAIEFAKKVGDKAVSKFKEILNNVGEFINQIKFFTKKIFNIVINFTKEFVIKQKDKFLGKKKEEIKKKMGGKSGEEHKEDIKKDAEIAKQHFEFTLKTGVGKYLDNDAKAKTGEIEKEVKAEIPEDEIKTAEKQLESFAEILDDMKDVEILEKLNDKENMFEAAEQDIKPMEITDEMVEENKFWKVIGKIFKFITTGFTLLIEKVAKAGSEKIFELWTGLNNKIGGPAASKLPAIALVIGAVVGIIVEVATAVVGPAKEGNELMMSMGTGIYALIHGTSILGLINVICKFGFHVIGGPVYYTVFALTQLFMIFLLLEELGIIEKIEEYFKSIKAKEDADIVTKLVAEVKI